MGNDKIIIWGIEVGWAVKSVEKNAMTVVTYKQYDELGQKAFNDAIEYVQGGHNEMPS